MVGREGRKGNRETRVKPLKGGKVSWVQGRVTFLFPLVEKQSEKLLRTAYRTYSELPWQSMKIFSQRQEGRVSFDTFKEGEPRKRNEARFTFSW